MLDIPMTACQLMLPALHDLVESGGELTITRP